jgi:hypothetical protein
LIAKGFCCEQSGKGEIGKMGWYWSPFIMIAVVLFFGASLLGFIARILSVVAEFIWNGMRQGWNYWNEGAEQSASK